MGVPGLHDPARFSQGPHVVRVRRLPVEDVTVQPTLAAQNSIQEVLRRAHRAGAEVTRHARTGLLIIDGLRWDIWDETKDVEVAEWYGRQLRRMK